MRALRVFIYTKIKDKLKITNKKKIILLSLWLICNKIDVTTILSASLLKLNLIKFLQF